MTIICYYTCAGCGATEVAVEVPARGEEGAADWMQETAKLLTTDHRQRSPHCTARAMQQIKIPITGRQKVGGPTVQ